MDDPHENTQDGERAGGLMLSLWSIWLLVTRFGLRMPYRRVSQPGNGVVVSRI